MKWFKHDSDASRDAKLRRVMIKYGMQGYGLYWYCLELICGDVDENNVSFELEHDAEIIAHETGINYQLVQEMMVFMVKQGLFESGDGVITCMKLAKRLDQSMTSNPKMRELIKILRIDTENHDGVMTESCKNRLDKNRIENKPKKPAAKALVTIDDFLSKCKESGEPTISPDDPILTYASEAGIPQEFIRLNWLEFIERNRESGKKYKDWRSAFRKCVRGSWYKLWWLDGESYLLSTNGKQAEIKHKNSGRL